MTDYAIWPDDMRRAAITAAMAADTQNDMQFDDVIASIEAGVNSGRPVEYVMELVRVLTDPAGARFTNPDTAAAYRQMAAQAQSHEDDMRSRGEWRNDNG